MTHSLTSQLLREDHCSKVANENGRSDGCHCASYDTLIQPPARYNTGRHSKLHTQKTLPGQWARIKNQKQSRWLYIYINYMFPHHTFDCQSSWKTWKLPLGCPHHPAPRHSPKGTRPEMPPGREISANFCACLHPISIISRCPPPGLVGSKAWKGIPLVNVVLPGRFCSLNKKVSSLKIHWRTQDESWSFYPGGG